MELACKVRVKVKSNSKVYKGGRGSVEMTRKVKIATSVLSFAVLLRNICTYLHLYREGRKIKNSSFQVVKLAIFRFYLKPSSGKSFT